MSNDLKELATAWAASQEIEGERTEAEWAPIFEVYSLLGHPEKLFAFVRAAEPLCTSEAAFGMLGAGPLEDLIQDHGEAFIVRLEQHAKENPRFARLFEHVWVPAGQDPITLRYLALGCTAVGPSSLIAEWTMDALRTAEERRAVEKQPPGANHRQAFKDRH